MRHFILAGSVALCLTAWSAPAPGVGMMIPLQTGVWHQEVQPNTNGPVMDSVEWMWDLMPDHLTVPLAPDDQNIWPLGTRGEQWIAVVADRGPVVETQVPFGRPRDERSKSSRQSS
jgi:hypothetical protein